MHIQIDGREVELNQEAIEYFDERAAIRQFEGKMAKRVAEALAIQDVKQFLERKEADENKGGNH